MTYPYEFNHVEWPSFKNIHYEIDSRKYPTDFPVVVTEKIDGSNFGIEIWRDKIVGINSRNCSLWNLESDQPMPVSFMKNRLDFIKDNLDKYIFLWKKLTDSDETKSIILFGEIFKSNHYPVGYAVRDLTGKNTMMYYTMSCSLWKLFNSVGLNPPKLYFDTDLLLSDAVKRLQETMLTADESFEGVFITLACNDGIPQSYDDVRGFKYKTGLFEEQPGWNVKEEYVPECFKDTVELLREVFSTKKSSCKPVVDRPVKSKDTYTDAISLAFKSAVSKSGITGDDVKKMNPENRNKTINSLVDKVYAEVLSQYSDPSLVDSVKLKKETRASVPSLLFR